MSDLTGSELKLQKGRIKNIGHEVNGRISDDACIQVAIREQERIIRVFEVANRIAEAAGRKTIHEQDVRMAYEISERVRGDL